MSEQQSNLMPLAQLMAYAAQADGQITPDELEALHHFLEGRFQDAGRAEFFTLFRSAVDNRPDLERLVAGIQDNLPDYHSRLEAYTTIRVLLTATGMTAEESLGLVRVASLLDITPADADLIANATAPVPEFQFPLNRDRVVRISGDERRLRLTVMDLGGIFGVTSDTVELFVNGVGHATNETIFLKGSGQLTADNVGIGFADLSRLFVLARNHVTCDCRLVIEGDRLVSVGQTDAASFEFRVNEAQLSFVKLAPDARVDLNGEALAAGALVMPADVLTFDGREIRVSQFLDGLDHSSWPLNPTADPAFHYAIANRPTTGTELLLTDLQEPLEIAILESGDPTAPLRLVCRQVPGTATLDGAPLASGSETLLSKPATLRIGHHWFAIDPELPNIDYSKRVVECFEAREVSYRFKNTGGLRDITFHARSGDLVGIMGSSGAGKSTLLGVLLGTLTPASGAVLLNGLPLGAQLRRNRSILGYVPQDDLLMDTLTVEENLLFSGRIRLPHLSAPDLANRVARVLRDIGLYEKRHLRVGNPVKKVLSGGQRKRLNIGIELLADPELFFLDEPTSGLSSQDSKMIMGLLSQLTRRGKLVFVVIHQPSSEIYKMLDKLLVLDMGGVLIWYGSARDAVRHFKGFLPSHREFVECPACGSINPETMLNAIEQPLSVMAGAADGRPRKFDSEFWRNAFLLSAAPAERAVTAADQSLPELAAVGVRGRGRAIWSSVMRAFIDRVRDRTNVAMSVAAPLALGLVMAGMLRGPDVPYTYAGNSALPRFLFLSTIVFVFFGLMASVNEVIRELPLIRRERVSGFNAGRYVVAKVLAFVPFSLLQVAIYCALASFLLQFPYRAPAYDPLQPAVPFPWYFAVIALLVVQGAFALGLLVSTFLRTQAAAFNWIPLIVIPQILLGGVFVDYDEMPKLANRVVPEYAQLTFTRWAYEALLAGEKDFNPSHTLNADEILALRARRQAAGLPFSLQEITDVQRRWEREPAFALPPARMSATVMNDRVLKTLRVHDRTAEAALLERSYERAGPALYTLKPDISTAAARDLAGILMSPDAGWWASTFATKGVNASLDRARLDAGAPLTERSTVLRDLVIDRNAFPVGSRVIGDRTVPVVIFNPLVLVAMIVGCYVAAILRLNSHL